MFQKYSLFKFEAKKIMKKMLFIVFVVFLSASTSVLVYEYKNYTNEKTVQNNPFIAKAVDYEPPTATKPKFSPPSNKADYKGNNTGLEFRAAAAESTPTVVHIKTTQMRHRTAQRSQSPFFDLFELFGGRDDFYQNRPQMSTGSGVIVDPRGFIVTNNHVVESSEEILVTLNNKEEYRAEIVGRDPHTDIAVIKINGRGFKAIEYGNSDDVYVGDWVLAVGNPFNLASTVTAGIVSAKGRDIDILEGDKAIESFIQTDAAVNPGNSGGALVNLRGELIGINSAIASPTGAFAGYSFAVPVNMVRKIVRDIVDYGIVQRAYLGIDTKDIDSNLQQQLQLRSTDGVYVNHVAPNSGASKSGLSEGDVLTELNGYKINSTAQMLEQLGRYSPGDMINITYLKRGRKKSYTDLTLTNVNLSTGVVTPGSGNIEEILGAKMETYKPGDLTKYGVNGGGVRVTEMYRGGALHKGSQVQPGFIILTVNGQEVTTKEAIKNAVVEGQRTGKGIYMEGFYPGDRYKKTIVLNVD